MEAQRGEIGAGGRISPVTVYMGNRCRGALHLWGGVGVRSHVPGACAHSSEVQTQCAP